MVNLFEIPDEEMIDFGDCVQELKNLLKRWIDCTVESFKWMHRI